MKQLELLGVTKKLDAVPVMLRGPDIDIKYKPDLVSPKEASSTYDRLLDGIQWRQDSIHLYGKTIPIPRLQQWYGDGESYTYSGMTLQPLPWTEDLLKLKHLVEVECGTSFNSVLANLYRNGDDHVSWHSDNEPCLGKNPIIASLSFGAERDFKLRRNNDHSSVITLYLQSGSILVMGGETQNLWQHCLPQKKSVFERRINLTFRTIIV